MFFCSEKKEAKQSEATLQKSLKKLNLIIDEMIEGNREIIPINKYIARNGEKNGTGHR